LKRALLYLVGIPIAIITLITAFISIPWILIFIGMYLQPNPPSPDVTYGEFPFKLVFEVRGERKEVLDTLICEFVGFGANEGVGKYRKWDSRFRSGNDTITLVKTNDNVEVYYPPGSCKYYMGDLTEGVTHNPVFPGSLVRDKEGSSRIDFISKDELFEIYKIKILSWEYSQPINNNFN